MATNGAAGCAPSRWSSRATSSLPVPLSPTISTVLGTGATRAICSRSRSIAALVPDERALAVQPPPERPHLGAEPAPLDRQLDLAHDPLDRLGLVDEAVGAEPDGLDAAVEVPGAGVDDHRDLRAAPLERAQHLEAVHARHLEVEDHAVDRLAAEPLERLRGRPAPRAPRSRPGAGGRRRTARPSRARRPRRAPASSAPPVAVRRPAPRPAARRSPGCPRRARSRSGARRRGRAPAGARSRARARSRPPWWYGSRRTRGRARLGSCRGPVSVTVTRTSACLRVADGLGADGDGAVASGPPGCRPRCPPGSRGSGGARAGRPTRAGSAGRAPRGASRGRRRSPRTISATTAFTSQRPRCTAGREPGVVAGPACRDRPGSTRASRAAPRTRAAATAGSLARHLRRDAAARSGSAPGRS